MAALQVVIDTNVLYAALHSPRGASYQVLRRFGSGLFTINLSVPVLLEYEAVLKRDASRLDLAEADIDALLDYVCLVAKLNEVHFSWRPTLRDPGDEMVLELAVAAGCDAIVTFNKRDFTGVAQFGLRLLTLQELLREIGVIG